MAMYKPVSSAALALVAFASPALAQDWPARRAVTMVVPFAAGGPFDTIGRILASGLTETLGQQVIVENAGGAGGVTGASRAAQGAPRGHGFPLRGRATPAVLPTPYQKALYHSPARPSPGA